MIITSGHQLWVPTQLKTWPGLWFPYYQFRSTSWFSDHTRGKSGSWAEENSDIIFQNKKISLKNSHPEQIRIICQSFLINDEGKKCIKHFLLLSNIWHSMISQSFDFLIARWDKQMQKGWVWCVSWRWEMRGQAAAGWCKIYYPKDRSRNGFREQIFFVSW